MAATTSTYTAGINPSSTDREKNQMNRKAILAEVESLREDIEECRSRAKVLRRQKGGWEGKEVDWVLLVEDRLNACIDDLSPKTDRWLEDLWVV